MVEDTRQDHDEKIKDKMTNNDLQNTIQKTNYWTTRTQQIPGCLGRIRSGTHRIFRVINQVISHEWGKGDGIVVITIKETYPRLIKETMIGRQALEYRIN
jgi:hypothetical protein